MKPFVLFLFGLMFTTLAVAQETVFRVELSTDSILAGNYLEVRFIIENGAGDFEAPDFEGFDVLVGPNTSSSFSMINGKVSQKASYTYVIRPFREGILYIEPAVFRLGETVLETDPIEIMVYPNPEGIEDNQPFRQEELNPFFQPVPKKKESKSKYKRRKI
jgi:hypothetical protein